MELFIHLVGFVGGWLLVAGPLYQATIELRDEEFDQEAFERSSQGAAVPPRMSPWWWLLPPVAYVKAQRRRKASRDAIFAGLTIAQRQQFVGFMNKAHGWFAVASGAFCIALKETWELVELLHVPVWSFWVAVVVLFIGVIVNTAVQQARSEAMIHVDDPAYRTRQRDEQRASLDARKKPKN